MTYELIIAWMTGPANFALALVGLIGFWTIVENVR